MEATTAATTAPATLFVFAVTYGNLYSRVDITVRVTASGYAEALRLGWAEIRPTLSNADMYGDLPERLGKIVQWSDTDGVVADLEAVAIAEVAAA